MAPQLTLVHALSHVQLASAEAQAPHEQRQQAPEKACDTCVLMAHLGQALTAQHAWALPKGAFTARPDLAVAQLAQRAPAHFHARGPPSLL